MSRVPPPSHKKRKLEDAVRGKTSKPKKPRIKRQRIEDYHSSSSEDSGTDERAAPDFSKVVKSTANDVPVGKRVKRPASPVVESADDATGSDDSADEDEGEGHVRKPKHKRNDPDAFATSISKILSTKLPQAVRQDPLLSRSKSAAEAGSSLANERLERKAKARLRAEKKEELDRGRVTDVLGIESGKTGEVAEEEKRLRKVAQRGVVALFNAFRAAQVRGEQTAKDEQKKGTVGISNREEKVKEMSKQGFLDLINGQKKTA